MRIADWLTRRNWRIVLYGNTNSRLIRQADEAGLPVRSFDLGSKLSDLWRARRLARQCNADQLDHFVIHTSRAIQFGVLCRRWSDSPFSISYMQHMQMGGPKRDSIHSWLYRKLDAWITPLELLGAQVREYTIVDPERIHIAPFGIETERFTRGLPDRTAARKRFLLPDDLPVVGLVGRLDPKKGQEELVRAAARLHEENHPVRLLIVGDRSHGEWEEFYQYLKRLTAELSIADYVTFHPHLNEIELAYAASDLFAMASHGETYGMVTIEAMAAGLPVVGTNSGGTPGILQHEQNGLLVPPRNARALADALKRLLDDESLRGRVAQKARTDAVEKYSHHTYCRRLEEIFGGLKSSG